MWLEDFITALQDEQPLLTARLAGILEAPARGRGSSRVRFERGVAVRSAAQASQDNFTMELASWFLNFSAADLRRRTGIVENLGNVSLLQTEACLN